MPQEEIQGVPAEVTEVIAPEPSQVEAPATQEQQPETNVDDELPMDAEKQREAFIKMRQENKALRDSLEVNRREELDVINQFRNNTFSQPETQLGEDASLDEFTQRFTQSESVAYQANNRVAQLERELEDQKLYGEFPELNPTSELAKKPESMAFEEFVAGKAAIEMLKGNRPNLIEIARQSKSIFSNLTATQKEAIAETITRDLQTKDNATLEARGTSFAPPQAPNLDAIRRRANMGDHTAIAELLKNRG